MDDLLQPPPQPAPRGVPPESLSRADVADYMARANWNPDQARTLAARETLSNLGAHPDVVAAAAPAQPTPKVATPQARPVAPVAAQPATPAPVLAPQPRAARNPNAPVRTPAPALNKPIDFSDLGGKPVAAAPGAIDFSDLGGKAVQAPAANIPSALADTTPMGEPPATPQTPDSGTGPWHHIGGFLQGAGENIGSAVKGVHDLFQEPQNDDEKDIQQKVMIGKHGELGGRLALAGYRFLHGVNDTLNQMDKAGAAGQKETKESGSLAAGVLTDAENEPFIGKAVKLSEQGEYGKALGDLLTSIALLRAGGKGASKLGTVTEDAEAAIPKPAVVEGTTLPETVGQSVAKTGATATDLKGMEDIAQKLPFSKPLREVGQSQQTAARQVLASKAAKTGATVSNAPEAIEENATAAAEKLRQAGSAKYEQIAEAAKGADTSKAIDAARSILTDENVSKVLPKATRDALSKVSSSLVERESVAKQIYGKAYNDLEPTQQSEVGKAMNGSQSAPGIEDVLKARSELAQAANNARDAADRFQMHRALDSFDGAIDETLKAHDAKAGANLSGDLVEAKKLWSQKYAYEQFRDGLQTIMRDQPHTGVRQINGEAFQKLINDLDPRGSTGATPLQRMFPGDADSVSDLHELADYMGRNQTHAGGMASGMAKLRLLGLKSSAIGLLTNVSGFSWLMSKPGLARAALAVMKGGMNSAKVSGAIGTLNSAAAEFGQAPSPSDTNPSKKTETSAKGFQRPEMEEHKKSGMKAASESPKTPEHLRPHLKKLIGDE